jgi:3'-phosphoadenosine 5'-phosphosulfate (PAPS) 3'-phosphatase
MVKSLDVILKQSGGAGKKILDLIKGDADFVIYIGKGTKKWDTAAGEALIQSFNGTLSGTEGS